jgi:integrase
MPRPARGPRLYLDKRRKQWVIRDGPHFVRTGCAQSDHEGANKKLAEYIGVKYRPADGPAPLVGEILLMYAQEHIPTTKSPKNEGFNVSNLQAFWAAKKVPEVTVKNCKAYAATKTAGGARRDLSVLRAAIKYWHKHHGPLPMVPVIWLPDKGEPRERWLTKAEARTLRKAAKPVSHLYRFVLIGMKTGSRLDAILGLEWDWIDLDRGLMRRRAEGTAETKKRTPPVRLGKSILAFLRLWKAEDGGRTKYVVHYNGKRIHRIKQTWDKACERAGLEDVTPHTLRHTRATWLMQKGIDPFQAAGHLGMSVEVLYKHYAKHHPDYQKDAADV